MKAWKVSNRLDPDAGSVVTFAETRGKAIYIAQNVYDEFGFAEFVNLYAERLPECDKYYVDGKKQMDWDNGKDRIRLAKLGFTCSAETSYWEDCRVCPARKYCDNYLEEQNYET